MDFNTGRDSGRSEDRPLFGGDRGRPTGGSPRGPVGGPGGEFNLQDPVNSFIGTVRNVVLDPIGFFRGIPRQGSFVNPLVFAVICALINGLLGGIIGFFISLAFGVQSFGRAFVGLISNVILFPIYAVIGLFIGAGIYYLLVLLFARPGNAGFEATFRVVSYASVAQLISWIPIIGWIVGPVWGIILSVLGIREVHATTTARALLIVLIPVAVIALLFILASSVLLFFLAGTQQQF